MIKYFSNKKKLFAAMTLSCFVFLNMMPTAALALRYFKVGPAEDPKVWISLDNGEELFNPVTNNQRGEVIVNGRGVYSVPVGYTAVVISEPPYFDQMYQSFKFNNAITQDLVTVNTGVISSVPTQSSTGASSQGTSPLSQQEQAQRAALLRQYEQYQAMGQTQQANQVSALYQSMFPASQGLAQEAAFSNNYTGSELGVDTDLNSAPAATQGIPQGEAGDEGPELGAVAEQSIAAIGTCSIGAILGRLLSSLIGQMVNALLNFITNTLLGIVSGVADCLMRPFQVCDTNPAAENQLSSLGEKETGESVRTLTGLAKFIKGISLDSIMFCIINEIITYITQSTIAWINSGFDGNPVFIQNPGALMQRVASQEANNFIYTAANGTQRAVSAGVHQSLGAVANQAVGLTGRLGESVTRGLIGSYQRDSSGNFVPMRPTLSDAQMRNSRYLGNWAAEGQRFYPGNYNPVSGAYAPLAYSYIPGMNAQIAQQQQMTAMQAEWNSGYYPFTACPPGQERPADGSCNPNSTQAIVQGSQVKGESEARNLTKYIRTATANSFDSIITALVNQLVKVAINKIFEVEQKVDGEVQGAVQRR